MPPRIKNAASNSSAKGKPSKPTTSSPPRSGTTTPSVQPEEQNDKGTSGARASRPDKAAYDAEQDRIKKEIDALQVKINAVQDRISSFSSSGPKNEKKLELRAEMDAIRQEQSKSRQSRGKVLDQLKALNEGVQKRVKDLQAARGKTQFRTVAEVDAHIKQLEKQVESGSMKLADEKRALQEISQSKRLRRTVESFQAEQDAVERDRAAADELRKQLDDPDWKSVNDRYDAIKLQLEEIKKEDDEAYTIRNKLFDERNEVKMELDELYRQKRESAQKYREENDRYWAKVNEDRARRAERARAQRAAEEEAKKKEIVDRLREEASVPAFQAEIEDCQTLIDYFSGKITGSVTLATSKEALSSKGSLVGVPKLELRQVDQDPGDGFVALKKKGKAEEDYFVSSKSKGKGRKGGSSKVNGGTDAPASHATNATSTTFNVPLSTLTALLALSIPPPSSTADVPRTVEDLSTKKAWFEANQARATAGNVAKSEAKIKKLLDGGKGDVSQADGEKPIEPVSTPAADGQLSQGVPSEEVDEGLENALESVGLSG